MKSLIVTPKVGFKNGDGKITERVCIPMREVSAAEESAFWVALSGLADKPEDQKTALQFDLMVETVASWTAEMPFIRKTAIVAGKETVTDTPCKGEDPAAAVREYFKDRTIRHERAVNAIINGYSSELAADVVF